MPQDTRAILSDRARSFNCRSAGDKDGSGKGQAGRGSERKGQHPSDVRKMGYEEGLGKTRPQNLRTQREEKQKKNDKPHIRQLVGGGLRCGQDGLAFSNELFCGFLMHGEETGRITDHEVRYADVRNGDLLRLNHPRAVQKHQQQQDAPAPEDKKAHISPYLILHTNFSL